MPEFHARELAMWARGRWVGAAPERITGISIDTRTMEKGELYIAIRGERFDGHDFVGRAFAQGAAGAVVEHNFNAPPAGGALLRVPNTRRALFDIAEGYRNLLATEMIAITGSVGKTTVKEMTADILSRRASTARTRGNWNNDIGVPLSLLRVKPSDQFGAFEVGMNHPGELDPLCRLLRPVCGVVTSVGPVHLEFFDSVEAIAREKAAVFRALPPHGVAILCRDNAYFDVLRADAACRVVTTSLMGKADYVGKTSSLGACRFHVTETATGRQTELETGFPGDYMAHNALLAIAAGRSFGADWDEIADALRNFRPLPLRWQMEEKNGVTFVNDAYNANPLSMRAALQAFSRTVVRGRRWLVLAGMRELGVMEAEAHRTLGREIAHGEWAGLIAVGPLGALIAEGAEAEGWSQDRVARSKDCASAARALKERARVGDAVLLKGSRGEHIEEVLKEWVKQHEKEGVNCAC